jgi:hypothetical protein
MKMRFVFAEQLENFLCVPTSADNAKNLFAVAQAGYQRFVPLRSQVVRANSLQAAMELHGIGNNFMRPCDADLEIFAPVQRGLRGGAQKDGGSVMRSEFFQAAQRRLQ